MVSLPKPEAEPAAERRAEELARLFQQHNRRLVSFLIKRLGSESDAQEVAQEAYAQLLRLDQRAESFLCASLYRIASNIAVDRIRRHASAARVDARYRADDLTDWVSPDREALAAEELAMAQRALAELPPRYRSAFALHRFHERSTAEIGEVLGLGDSQVRLYLRRVIAYCQLRLNGLSARQAHKEVFR